MSHKIEVKLDDTVYKLVQRMAEAGIGRGRGERKKVTIAEMCAALVSTGALRRIAANKWAREHAKDTPKKPCKPKAAKVAKKAAPKAQKPARKSAAKKPAPRKAKPKAAPAPAAEPLKPSLPAAAAGGVLD